MGNATAELTLYAEARPIGSPMRFVDYEVVVDQAQFYKDALEILGNDQLVGKPMKFVFEHNDTGFLGLGLANDDPVGQCQGTVTWHADDNRQVDPVTLSAEAGQCNGLVKQVIVRFKKTYSPLALWKHPRMRRQAQ